MRVIRAWNQTGQKHASRPDIARGIFPTHSHLLWSLVMVAYTLVWGRMLHRRRARFPRPLYLLLATVVCITGFAFKVSFTAADAPELLGGMQRSQMAVLGSPDLVMQARAIFLGLALLCTEIFLPGSAGTPGKDQRFQTRSRNKSSENHVTAQLQALQGVLSLFLMTQSRVTNIPLFALFELQMQTFFSMNLSPSEIGLTSIILQYTSFFSFGGSNAISSIDLSNAYNGVADYNVAAVGVSTFCSNWAGPIWWTFATMLLLSRSQLHRHDPFTGFYLFSTVFVANAALYVMLACTALRTHLFVWTVFSPKYLYTIAWSLGQHLCVNTVAVCCFLWFLNS